MKRINILLLGIIVLILTGCTAEVNIDLSESSIKEQVIIIDKDKSVDVATKYRQYVPVYYDQIVADTEDDVRKPDYTYYNRSSSKIPDGNKITYDHLYSLSDYNKSNMLKGNFRSGAVEYSIEEGTISIYTDANGILAFDSFDDLTSVKVNIMTDLEVIESNADEENNGMYTWNITKNNTRRNIYLQAKNKLYYSIHPEEKKNKKNNKKSNQNEEDDTEESEKTNYWIYVLLVVIGFPLLLILVSLIYSKLSR